MIWLASALTELRGLDQRVTGLTIMVIGLGIAVIALFFYMKRTPKKKFDDE